ncbi:MAG TPA: hypothetical protein DEV98_06120 [Clostridiales bacterium]|nr:hypothetical protein [Clostridiales bacterium]
MYPARGRRAGRGNFLFDGLFDPKESFPRFLHLKKAGNIVLYILSNTVVTLLSAVEFLLLVRAVLSWVAPDSDHPVSNAVFTVTDWILAPMRALLDKTGWFQNSMIDMSYLLTILVLWGISSLFLFL